MKVRTMMEGMPIKVEGERVYCTIGDDQQPTGVWFSPDQVGRMDYVLYVGLASLCPDGGECAVCRGEHVLRPEKVTTLTRGINEWAVENGVPVVRRRIDPLQLKCKDLGRASRPLSSEVEGMLSLNDGVLSAGNNGKAGKTVVFAASSK